MRHCNHRFTLQVLLSLALGFVSAGARAYPDEPYSLDEAAEGSEHLQLVGELGVFAGKQEGGQKSLTISPLVEARISLTSRFLLQAVLGLSYARIDRPRADAENTLRFGNPYAAVHYHAHKNQYSYRVGLGATVPVASVSDDINRRVIQSSAYYLAAALRGNADLWLWDPHTLALILPVALERRKPSGFLWGAYLHTGILFKLSDKNPRSTDRNMVLQMAMMMGYQVTEWLRTGSRFTLAVIPKWPEQRTQLSVEPYARLGRDNVFAAVRLNINIDNPHGFSFDSRQVWGLRVALGGAF